MLAIYFWEMSMKLTLLLLLLLLLNSCTLLAPSSGTVVLNVSGPSDTTNYSCHSGVQATITILSDQVKLTSPIVKKGETFQLTSDKSYDEDTRIKIEAYCYENDTTVGELVIEGKVRPPLVAASYRTISVSSVDSEEDLTKYCVSTPLSAINQSRDMNILKITEPIPCIESTGFSL